MTAGSLEFLRTVLNDNKPHLETLEMTQNILINNQFGHDDVEKATIAMTIANVASTKDCQTMMFLTCDAVDLVLKKNANELHLEGYRSVSDLKESYIANGGKFWVCKACADAKGINQEDLIESARLAGASDTIAYLEEGAHLLM
jgi:predicted peroxiredoxin